MKNKGNKGNNALISKRRFLTGGTVIGAVVVSKIAPESWKRPIIDQVILPAHAQTSGDEGGGGGGPKAALNRQIAAGSPDTDITLTIPPGMTTIQFRIVGGAGGGGAGGGANFSAAGSGVGKGTGAPGAQGFSGETFTTPVYSVTPGATVIVRIGKGGDGGEGKNAGGGGGGQGKISSISVEGNTARAAGGAGGGGGGGVNCNKYEVNAITRTTSNPGATTTVDQSSGAGSGQAGGTGLNYTGGPAYNGNTGQAGHTLSGQGGGAAGSGVAGVQVDSPGSDGSDGAAGSVTVI